MTRTPSVADRRRLRARPLGAEVMVPPRPAGGHAVTGGRPGRAPAAGDRAMGDGGLLLQGGEAGR